MTRVLAVSGRWAAIALLSSTIFAILPAVTQPANELDALKARVTELYQQGRYGEAVGLAEDVVRLAERSHGPDHPAVGTSLNTLGALYRALGRYTEAEPLFKRGLAIAEKTRGPDHPDVGAALNNLAGLHQDQGRYAEAELSRCSSEILPSAAGLGVAGDGGNDPPYHAPSGCHVAC